MIQVIFLALLIVTLLGGFFAYYAPAQKAINPVKFVMDNTGYNTTETINRKRSEQINMTTSRGLMQIHRQMDDLALEQNKFMDTIQDQQQVLQAANKDAYNILLEAKKQGKKGDKDILQLEALTSQMQDEQNLLVSRGQDLVSLNNQLTRNRQLIAEQADLANINTEGSLHALQQQYTALNNQASGFFDQVSRHNEEMHDQIEKMQSNLREMADNAAYTSQQQSNKGLMQRMMDQEHEDMIKLAYNEQRCRAQTQDARQNLVDSQERLEDSQQKTKDLIEEERQKEEDQQSIVQQRIADEEQRVQDQQDR